MARGVRKAITIPGILAPAVAARYREFGFISFSPYGVELALYDIRSGSPHTITLQIARDTLAAQDAVDQELVRHYRPGAEKSGLLVRFVDRLKDVQHAADEARENVRQPPLNAKMERLTFSHTVWPLVDVRWRELGYPTFSAYITGLIRYDLMLGGPHHFTAADAHPRRREWLEGEAAAARREVRKRKTYLDHLIERTLHQQLTPQESENMKAQIALLLRKSVAPKRASAN